MADSNDPNEQWWRNAVVYQVYVRSFADSDGDGIGDLPGITSRLPHLAELGVDALWITPFYTSPQHDHGYDVADYCDVDPLFGRLSDADDLDRARARARPEGDRRPGPQPLLRRARVVPGRTRRRARQPRARPLPLPRQRGRQPAQQLGVRLRWSGVDPGRRRPVVPPPLRLLPARLRLAQPRGPRDVRGRAALLARPRRRRLPGRRGARPLQGGLAARPGRGGGRARRFGARRPTRRWSSATSATSRCGTSPRCTTSTAPGTRSSTRPAPTGWPSPRHGPQTVESMAAFIRPDELDQTFNFAWLLAQWSASPSPRSSPTRSRRSSRSTPRRPGCSATTTSSAT